MGFAEVAAITQVRARAFTIPTEALEADGTLSWDKTTLVLVEIEAGGKTSIGFSYTHSSAAPLIRDLFAPLLVGRDPFQIESAWYEMLRSARNIGTRGLVASAISAVDVALWDLKAKLLEVPLSDLFGRVRQQVDLYASGGFTSYDEDQLRRCAESWAQAGFQMVKIKVGARPSEDEHRIAIVRGALGKEPELFVDANGAYRRDEALRWMQILATWDVRWFEEPVSSDDIKGLCLIREHAPCEMSIAAGEYGYDPFYYRELLENRAVDVVQVDVTRCLGFTGFLKVAAYCQTECFPLSTHTAPSLHLPLAVSVRGVKHLEYFHDHVRIERMLFDGVKQPSNGILTPDRERSGLGLSLKDADAMPYLVVA